MRKNTIVLICFLLSSIVAYSQEDCSNGIDDDNDSLIDLNDTDDCSCIDPSLTPINNSLIPNPSFEDHTCCPSSWSELFCANDWEQATETTSDYYNTCGYTPATSPLPIPHGEGFSALIITEPYREYIGACLTSQMIAGQEYALSFNIATVPSSGVMQPCTMPPYGPIDFTIYGRTFCPTFPISIGPDGCPANFGWTILGSATYTPSANWGILTIVFTPTQNISSIMLGAPCTIPSSYPTVNTGVCYPYFFIDNLLLNYNEPINVSINQSGALCNNNLELQASTTSNGGFWQWYYNGIAIIGETSSSLPINSGQLGTYTVMYTAGGLCGTDEIEVTNQSMQDATINPQGNLCENATNVILSAVTPGGTWSGTGIINSSTGEFSPSIAGVGSHQINYVLSGFCPDDDSIVIVVEPYLDASIFPAGPFCIGQGPVNLQAQSLGGIWAGPGITDANNGTFNPNNSGTGVHNITYTTPGMCGETWGTFITVTNGSSASIEPAGPFCENQGNQILNATPPNGTWSGTGIVNTVTGEFSPSIAGPGNHIITYSIAGACSNAQDKTIQVNPMLINSITPVGPFCQSDAPVSLQAQLLGGVWAGQGITDTVNGTFNPNIAGPGTHSITYKTPGGCSNVADINLIVSPEVYADINSVGPFCHNDPNIQLTAISPNGIWSGNGIIDSSLGIYSPSAAGDGVHTITYTITGTCSDVMQTNIEVYPPLNMTISNDTTICLNGTAFISTGVSGGTGNYTLQWDGNLPEINQHFVSPTSTTTYVATFDDGCEVLQRNVTVNLETVPNPSFSVDNLTGCVPFNVELSNLSLPGSVSCEWFINNDFYANDCSGANALITNPGCYDVELKLTTPSGCQDSITYINYICGEAYPTASFSANPNSVTTINTEVDFINLTSGADYYDWNFGDGSFNSQDFEPTHNFPNNASGIYTTILVASTSFGCADTAMLEIHVKEDLIFYIPNSFTPDGSELNNLWAPIFHSGVDPLNFSLYVFNRWGELIWESHDNKKGWDGTYGKNSNIKQSGTYIWKMEFKDVQGKFHVYNGHVNLLK